MSTPLVSIALARRPLCYHNLNPFCSSQRHPARSRTLVVPIFPARSWNPASFTAWQWLRAALPCLDWLLAYDLKRDLKGDLVAGLSVGFMIIPQGMAYARVAGLPAIYGLYTGFVPCLVYR